MQPKRQRTAQRQHPMPDMCGKCTSQISNKCFDLSIVTLLLSNCVTFQLNRQLSSNTPCSVPMVLLTTVNIQSQRHCSHTARSQSSCVCRSRHAFRVLLNTRKHHVVAIPSLSLFHGKFSQCGLLAASGCCGPCRGPGEQCVPACSQLGLEWPGEPGLHCHCSVPSQEYGSTCKQSFCSTPAVLWCSAVHCQGSELLFMLLE